MDYLLPCRHLLHQNNLIIFQAEESSASGVSALNLINVGGIFLVLLIGLVLGIFMAAIEKFWNAWKKKKLFNWRSFWLINIRHIFLFSIKVPIIKNLGLSIYLILKCSPFFVFNQDSTPHLVIYYMNKRAEWKIVRKWINGS